MSVVIYAPLPKFDPLIQDSIYRMSRKQEVFYQDEYGGLVKVIDLCPHEAFPCDCETILVDGSYTRQQVIKECARCQSITRLVRTIRWSLSAALRRFGRWLP